MNYSAVRFISLHVLLNYVICFIAELCPRLYIPVTSTPFVMICHSVRSSGSESQRYSGLCISVPEFRVNALHPSRSSHSAVLGE